VNAAHAVAEYERAGVAAVVIEDEHFPKVTSLAPGQARQDLVRTEEFQGKIEASRAVRHDPGLLVIARTQALIAGLSRAEAGADMVLVHSKQKMPDEVDDFCRACEGRTPLMLLPTSYRSISDKRCASFHVGDASSVVLAKPSLQTSSDGG
jgi:phosphoenolpyruvate phosphomutase